MSFKSVEFGISKAGFIPETPSSKRLPEYYDPWERLASRLSVLNSEKKTRQAILALPLLEVNDQLLGYCEEYWRRAYVVLTFLGQSYIWVEGEASVPSCVPRCIAVPWWRVADHFGLPPVVTYAATTLFNCYLLDSTKPIQANNLGISLTFTGTRDEEWFYLVPLFIEIEAASVISTIEEVHKAMLSDDNKVIRAGLQTIKQSIIEIIKLLNQIYDQCSPDVFYDSIRPYQAGSKGLDAFPNGIVYEGVADSEPQQYSGASAAQNSCIPMLDIFFGVEHEAGTTEEFLRLQRNHMPNQHRKFLEMLEQKESVKAYIDRSSDDTLVGLYDEAVKELAEFRSQHIILVTHYIIQPKAKRSEKFNRSLQAKGTGGSNFMAFLKSSRDDTTLCRNK